MNAYSLGALVLAVALFLGVVYAPGCKDSVIQAASLISGTIIGGVFGLARNQAIQQHPPKEQTERT